MFDSLISPPPDAILGLMATFRDDPRTDKLDLGVGVYKDASGRTPVMAAVREAETRLARSQTTKAYVGPIGSRAFATAVVDQVFGDAVDLERASAAQTVGGSGALRLLGELLHAARPGVRIHLPDPTWATHVPLLAAAGLPIERYPYLDRTTGTLDIDAMLAALGRLPAGDIVLLHGCCHNPSGADPSAAQWRRIVDTVAGRGLFPFVDLAYQGFGKGLEEDAAATRLLAARVPEMVVATSCSKHFGLYRERTGAALVIARDARRAGVALERLGALARANYSMPPDHGASVVTTVLGDAGLEASWRDELDAMRMRIARLRVAFADALRLRSNSDRFDVVARHRGMFSLLPLTPGQIDVLREHHGVYLIRDGRMNVAGLPEDPASMTVLADAIVSVSVDE